MREETKQKIFIIGCGGTGSNYIKELARYLATNRNYMINADVILIDGDTVEEKNLERQSFTPEDLLMNKAEAMALAVSDMYNLTFSYVPEYIASKEHMLRIMRNTYERESYEEEETFVPIIIGCVDNHNCRKILHEIFEEYTDIIYIDAANEFSTGEVVVGIKNNQAVIAPDRAFYFPEVLEDSKSVLEMSCTELNNVKPQHLVTNLFAANICLIQTFKYRLHFVWSFNTEKAKGFFEDCCCCVAKSQTAVTFWAFVQDTCVRIVFVKGLSQADSKFSNDRWFKVV